MTRFDDTGFRAAVRRANASLHYRWYPQFPRRTRQETAQLKDDILGLLAQRGTPMSTDEIARALPRRRMTALIDCRVFDIAHVWNDLVVRFEECLAPSPRHVYSTRWHDSEVYPLLQQLERAGAIQHLPMLPGSRVRPWSVLDVDDEALAECMAIWEASR